MVVVVVAIACARTRRHEAAKVRRHEGVVMYVAARDAIAFRDVAPGTAGQNLQAGSGRAIRKLRMMVIA